jgi:hypothetical protein
MYVAFILMELLGRCVIYKIIYLFIYLFRQWCV